MIELFDCSSEEYLYCVMAILSFASYQKETSHSSRFIESYSDGSLINNYNV